MKRKFLILGLFFIGCINSFILHAEEPLLIEPTQVFEASKAVALVHEHREDGSHSSVVLFPKEKTKENNRLGYHCYIFTYNGKTNILFFMYCSCKRKEGMYDMYSVLLPAERNSRVLHSSYSISNNKIVHSGFLGKIGSKQEYSPVVPPKDFKTDLLNMLNKSQGDNTNQTKQRLLSISSLHSQGGRKKVKESLGGRLVNSLGELSKYDIQGGSNLPEDNPKQTSEIAKKTSPDANMPIHVQNNKGENLLSIGSKKVAITKISDDYVHLSWMIELTNNTPIEMEYISVEHFTISDDELQLDHSMEIVKKLQPNETRKVRGTELVERALWSKACSHEFHID